MTVTAVVCAAFDRTTDERIDALRDTVAASGVRVRRAHRPHLTLAAARVADPTDVVPLVGEVASRHRAVPLTLTGLDRFAGGVLWIGVDTSVALSELQRDVHDSLVSAGFASAFGRQSDPTDWIAHCTLATRVPAPTLDQLLHNAFEPFPALVAALGLLVVGAHGDVAVVPLED